MDSSSTANIKGIKFQSYRIVSSLIKKCSENTQAQIYYAIERLDDENILDLERNKNLVKQTKNYASDFTINSIEIKKTLINFYNLFTKFPNDDTLTFEFCTISNYKEQNATNIINDEEVKALKEKNITFLEILHKSEVEKYEEIVFNVVCRVLKLENNPSNLKIIKEFLRRITWYFGVMNLEDTKNEAIEYLKKTQYYDYTFKDKEHFIFTSLTDLVENNALKSNSLNNYISCKDLKETFRQLKESEYKILDEASKDYDELLVINQKNIEEKINSVAYIERVRYFNLLKRKITTCKADLLKITDEEEKTILYRVYEACEQELYNIEYKDEKLNETDINDVFKRLEEKVIEYISDRKKDFRYAFNTESIYKNSVYVLFNECYLDFIKKG